MSELAVSGHHLQIEPDKTEIAVTGCMCNAEQRSRLHFTLRNQCRTSIFRCAYIFFLAGFKVDITEMGVVELKSANFLQLLFDTSTSDKCIFQTYTDILLIILFIGEKKFQESADCLFYCYGISLVKVLTKTEILLYSIAETTFTHFAQTLREIIRNETIGISEEFGSHLRYFPAGKIMMESVEEGGVNHIFRKWCQQMAYFNQIFDAAVNISYKHHRGIGVNAFFAAAERSIGHVSLHDLNTILVFHVDACDLIEGYNIPCTDKAHSVPPHIIEEICDRGLSSGNQD